MNYSFSLQIVEKKPGFPNQKKKKKNWQERFEETQTIHKEALYLS